MSTAWGSGARTVQFKWFLLGWLSILLLKYVIFGITAWNNLLHPGLIPAPNQVPFLKPFFGLGQQ